MSAHIAVSLYVEGDTVHVHDRNGWGEIPARVVHVLANYASQYDHESAVWCGRRYHRDLLNSARDLLDGRDQCANCKDEPGTNDMGDGTRFCAECCSAAQGSHYDDKEDWS